jgi:hypothetical protein
METMIKKDQRIRKTKGMRVSGEQRPLLPEGVRTMTCIAINENVQTRFRAKDYLQWQDEQTGETLTQYFNCPEKTYSHESKAGQNYMIGLSKEREEMDELKRIRLSELVGLRAEVTVEVVCPKYKKGPLAGKSKRKSVHYSKVGDIVRPLGWSKKEKR